MWFIDELKLGIPFLSTLPIYCFLKRSVTYFITNGSIIIHYLGKKYIEITFDQIKGICLHQGFLARIFNCGSLVFLTPYSGGIFISKYTGHAFFDVYEPEKVRELLMNMIQHGRSFYNSNKR
jgi:hypothetical protein